MSSQSVLRQLIHTLKERVQLTMMLESDETYIFQNLEETVIEVRRNVGTGRRDVAGDDNFRRN